MALSTEDRQFLKSVMNALTDKPLPAGDPRYQPVYDFPGCEDPIDLLQRKIDFADVESLSLFSGFRGSGKTTELFRLQKRLENDGYFTIYADSIEYLNSASPVEISDLLIVLAGAFGDGLARRGIDLRSESYWTRFWQWLNNTNVNIKELGFKADAGLDPIKAGADLKVELKTTPSFRQRLASALSGRIGELHAEIVKFFEDGFKAIRKARGPETKVVFLFDSLEQIRGSLSDAHEVTRSVELLFSSNLNLLNIPYIHVVYTVPPWLKFVLPGVNMVVLPCLRTWNNDAVRSPYRQGILALRSMIERRFSQEGLIRLFGRDADSQTGRLIELCGGHLRDLLLLLRETVLRANSLPSPPSAMQGAILQVKNTFLPITLDDARWLGEIERERSTLLKSRDASEIGRLTMLIDTHLVLYLRNGDEWYDVHPLVRDEVASILKSSEAFPEP